MDGDLRNRGPGFLSPPLPSPSGDPVSVKKLFLLEHPRELRGSYARRRGTLAAGIPRSPLGPDVPPWAEVREFRVPANGQQRQPAVPKDARATATSQREVSRSQEPPSATATAAATAAAPRTPQPRCAARRYLAAARSSSPELAGGVCPSVRPTVLRTSELGPERWSRGRGRPSAR